GTTVRLEQGSTTAPGPPPIRSYRPTGIGTMPLLREIGETCGPGTFIQKPRSIPLNREPPMDPQSTVTLHTGSPMPILGLGTWQLTEDTAATVEDAFRLGYRMIDTSGDYGTQPGIGEAIKHAPVISAYRASSAMPYMVQNGAVEPLPLSRQPIDAGSQP